MRNSILAYLTLGILTLAVFLRVSSFDFISYDDPAYITENEAVSRGLSPANLKWAATEVGETNLWHPLTWLSHMTDVEVFGLENAGGHHVVNLFWHLVAVIGLAGLLHLFTGNVWLSAGLALLWAIHPQRVQSVVWLSERKDVLSGAFLFWSWWAWEKSRRVEKKRALYLLSIMLFVAAGLSKPSVVPLPLVLLAGELLRRGSVSLRASLMHWSLRLTPFFLVSALVAVLTIYFQQKGGMADVTTVMPLERRLSLMPIGLWWYLKKFFGPFPGELWVYPPQLSLLRWVGVFVGLALSGGLIWFCRKEKLVLLGAAAFLLFWLPVSGIVPVSFYFVADRYSYLIQIGLILALAGALMRVPFRQGIWVVAILSAGLTWVRVGHWENSETLFSHERSINPRSLLAPIHLGSEMEDQGKNAEALAFYQEAQTIDPESGLAATNAGRVLITLGRNDEAEKSFVAATKAQILHGPTPFTLLAKLRVESGKLAAAHEILKSGLVRFPQNLPLMIDLGSFELGYRNNPEAALKWYSQALALEPTQPDAMQGAGVALLELGRTAEGKEMFQELVREHPERTQVQEFLKRL